SEARAARRGGALRALPVAAAEPLLRRARHPRRLARRPVLARPRAGGLARPRAGRAARRARPALGRLAGREGLPAEAPRLPPPDRLHQICQAPSLSTGTRSPSRVIPV